MLAAPSANSVRDAFGVVPTRFDLGVPRPGVGVGNIGSELVRLQFGHVQEVDHVQELSHVQGANA